MLKKTRETSHNDRVNQCEHVHKWNGHSAKHVNTTNEMVEDLTFKNPCELSKISESVEKSEQNSIRKAMIIHIHH
mgnify:CR=1 FL=1